MPRKNIFFFVLVVLAGLVFLAAASLPYGALKSLADSMMSDGNFKSLKEGNALVFKIALGAIGLLFFGVAYVIRTGRFKDIINWLHQYFIDLADFFRALIPVKVEAVSLVALMLIIVLAVILRLAHIADPMTHDESYTFLVFSSTSIFNITTNYHLPNNHVLNSLLIFFSTHLFGIQPWAVRLPSMLAGVLLVPATYILAKAIYDRYTALVSAFLIAILPGAILYSTVARGYILVALFTVLTLWLANYLRENKNWFAWSLLVLFMALGFYSVPVMMFPCGVVFAWLFLENLVNSTETYDLKINFLKHWLLAALSTAALVLILYTPIFIYTGVDKVIANHWVLPESWNGYGASIPHRMMNVWREWTSDLPSIWIILLIAGFGLSLVFHRRLSRQRFPLQVAAFLWITALLFLRRPEGVTKIWVFLQAPGMMWSASGIVGLFKDARLKYFRNISVATVMVGIVVIITVAGIIQIAPTLPDQWAQKGPDEGTILSIKDRVGPRDLIIVDSPNDMAFWYYSQLYGLSKGHFDKNLPFDQLFVIVNTSFGQTVQSVLEKKGVDLALVNLDAAHLTLNREGLDTYLVPHR